MYNSERKKVFQLKNYFFLEKGYKVNVFKCVVRVCFFSLFCTILRFRFLAASDFDLIVNVISTATMSTDKNIICTIVPKPSCVIFWCGLVSLTAGIFFLVRERESVCVCGKERLPLEVVVF